MKDIAMVYDKTLARALSRAKETCKDAGPYKQAAIANTVAYAMTGMSGGYGGPSVREHVASSEIDAQLRTGPLSFEEAFEIVSKSVTGPLTEEHEVAFRDKHCFDDDPKDLRKLQK